MIELRIEALKNYQKANDLKLSLYLQQNFEPKQAFLNLPGFQGTYSVINMQFAVLFGLFYIRYCITYKQAISRLETES